MIFDVERLQPAPQALGVDALAPRLAGRPALSLGQHWRSRPQPGLQPAQVQLGWSPQALWIHARLDDEDIFNSAERDNTPSHETGDVFEIFLGAAQRAPYIELHITPDNRRLHLRWPDPGAVAGVRDGAAPLARYISAEPLFTSAVQIDGSHWRVVARVPVASLGGAIELQPGQQLYAAFCRYDAYRNGRATVCSATAPFTAFDFHRPQEWTPLRLVELA